MSDYVLSIIARAKDEASGVLGGVHGALGGLGNLMGGALVVGAGAAVAGIGLLTGALTDAVREASAAQQVQAQLDAVLKSTGGAAGMTSDAVNALATSLSEVTRYEDDTIMSAQNMLLTFTNIGKDIFPQTTQAVLDISTAMGTDLKSAALMVGKALQDPEVGMTALTRAGVNFTDAQKEVIKGMVASGDAAGAQALILKELQKEFGGSAEAAGKTFAGQLDILNNKIGNVKEGVGMALLPVLAELANTLGPVLMEAAQAFAGWLTNTVIPVLTTLLEWLQTNLPPALQKLSDFWNTVLLPAITKVWNFISTYVVPLFKGLVDVEIALLKLALQALAGLWENVLQPALKAVWKFINENILPIFNSAAKVTNETLGPALTWLSDKVLGPLQGAFEGIGRAIGDVIGWLEGLAKKIGEIHLPSWLTPGSPTPFELGLLGIVDALQQVAAVDVPLFGANPQLRLATAGGQGDGETGRYGDSYVFNVTVHASGDAQAIGVAVESGVLRAARAMGVR